MKRQWRISTDKILAFCGARRTGTVLAMLVMAVFFILSLTRNYDFKTFESILSASGDDWGIYARYALDIKKNGLLMPSVSTSYSSPSGFLYNYFIALCLVVFGEKSLPIFVIQHLMLGLSVALVYWTFREKMRGFTSLLFLLALFVFALKDVYKNYSPLLLSENLALFTVSAFFFSFVRGFEKDNLPLQLVAAVFLGLSILTRPNIFIYAVVLVPLIASYYLKKGKAGLKNLLMFISVLILSASFLLIRNYLLLRRFYFLPTYMSDIAGIINFCPIPASVDLSRVNTNFLFTKLRLERDLVAHIEYVLQQPCHLLGFYFKKVLFCLGYLRVLTSAYGLRLRWVIMWIGYFAYLFLRLRERGRWEMWEVAVHLYILCYYGSLIMTTYVHNYGFRMLVPGLFFVLVFAFMALDRLRISIWMTKRL